MKMFSTVALAAILCAAPSVVHAQDSDDEAEITKMAKEHYKAGLDAYKSGKYDVAIKELKKAYLLKRLPALLLNIGATYRKMGDLDLALHFYSKYLEEAPAEARDRGEVEKIVSDIKAEKSGGGVEGTAPRSKEREEEAPAPPPRREEGAREWNHNVVDAAPPEQPLDVRVAMPVMKGVKVYVYYRGAGEESFKPVLMKRRGTEKVGRIPADAMQGKAIQYYIEAKDNAGTVVKSSGSQTSPNIVMIDPSAPPQYLASFEERRERAEEAAPESGDEEERPRKKNRLSRLDEEEAPVTGALDEDRPRKKKTASGPSKFGPMFWAGVGLLGGGVALAAGGIGFGVQAKNDANTISQNSQNPTYSVDGQDYNIYYNNDPGAPGGKQDAQVASEGKLFNALGITFDVIGGVAAATGIVLMVVDQVGRPSSEKPKKHRRPRSESVDEAKATPWYIAPTAGKNFAGVGGGFAF